jgi:hypothetical protein
MPLQTNNPSLALQRQDGSEVSEKVATHNRFKFMHAQDFGNPNRLEPKLNISDTLQTFIRKWEAERYLVEEIKAEPLLTQDVEQLIELGIPRGYIERDRLNRCSPILRAKVSFDSNGRFFSVLHGDPEAVVAFVFAVPDTPGCPQEIIAWHPVTDRVASFNKAISVIGTESLFGYRIDQHVTIHPTLLSWLSQGRKGAFLRDEYASLPSLRDAGGLHFLDPEQAKRIYKLSVLQNITVESPYAEGN